MNISPEQAAGMSRLIQNAIIFFIYLQGELE